MNWLHHLTALLLLLTFTVKGQNHTIRFKKRVIHDSFVSEGVATADVNNDGQLDILAGPFWFEAPDWRLHQIFAAPEYDFKTEWSDSFLNFATDINQDGWTDLIVFDFPGTTVHWFQNPGRETGFWAAHLIDSTARNESPMLVDIDQDQFPDLVFGTGDDQITWFEPSLENGAVTWHQVPISVEEAPGGSTFSHGLGFSDLDLDGKKDVFTTGGWWKAPDNYTETPWEFHATNLGKPCSQMYAYDLDLDGDQDVISASAHDYGMWWHQQSAPDHWVFTENLIDSTFSQTHAVAFEDLNEDGLPDIITGKRFFAHNGKDPGGYETPVLFWFEFKRDDRNQPYWVPHQIDQDSGVGLQVVVQDIDGNGSKDILIANKKGVILFESY